MKAAGQHPQLVLIADGFTQPGIDQRIVQAVRYGVAHVILRDQTAREDVMELSARLLIGRMRAVSPDIQISLNGPETLARALDVGWHRTSHVPFATPALSGAESSGSGQTWEGRSTHSIEEIHHAREEGLDYVLFGHVFDTASHRGEAPRGLSALEEAVQAAESMPVIAIGGITPERVRMCLEVGATGVAVLSGLMQAPILFQAVDAFSQALATPFPED